ncbi:MAG: potassium channel protein [Deinococcales bacterium]
MLTRLRHWLTYQLDHWRLSVPLTILTLVLLGGTLGYYWLWRDEGGSLGDALFMTIITITTIGYGEVKPLDAHGRVLSAVIAILGIGSMSYVFGTAMEGLVARQLQEPWRKRKMKRMIEGLSNHIIVAGFGQMGRWVAEELHVLGEAFVVVDHDKALLVDTPEDYASVFGDATEDHVLEEAGVARAKSLIAVTSNDASNAFVVMTARALNGGLHIVARAEHSSAVRKLKRAGADAVIDTYALSGRRLVRQVLNPSVINFLEIAGSRRDDSIALEEIVIQAESQFKGKSLSELNLRQAFGINILAILRQGKPITHLQADTLIEGHDVLIVLGNKEQLSQLSNHLGS